MKKLIITLVGALLINCGVFSQEKETLSKLEQALISASRGRSIYSLYQIIESKNIPIRKMLAISDKFRVVQQPEVQRALAVFYADLALYSNDQKLKEKLINKMLDCCSDSMNLSYGCAEASTRLRLFRIKDFNSVARKRITEKSNNSYPDEYLILISGMLDQKELIPKFKALLKDENYYPKYEVRKALARMSDQESIDFWVNQFDEQNPFNDFKLLETLLYIRQPVSIPIFEKLLFSEDGLDPEEPGGKGDPYASFGMYYLGLLLEDFPIPTRRNERSWDEANFALARQWMLANKGKYKIRRDEF
jgi:hypothetical protein